MNQSPKMVFVNHGDDTVCDSFVNTIEKSLSYSAVAPFSGDSYDLLTGECVRKGMVVRIEKKSKGRRQANAVYERLVIAGKRIARLIENMKYASNKDIARLADQLDILNERYKR